jgi:glycosyltransferase involved in cell wall biosynthesis
VAVFVGTPDARKGIQDAIAAFASPRLAFAELWILGDGGGRLARVLEKRSTPNVRWLGRKPPAETAARMAQAWCLLIPTRADTGPMAMKEARAIGLPVVTTREGGQTDYIEDGQNGFFVQPFDVATLVDRLAAILSDFEFATRLGRWKHLQQREELSGRKTAADFLNLYGELTR